MMLDGPSIDRKAFHSIRAIAMERITAGVSVGCDEELRPVPNHHLQMDAQDGRGGVTTLGAFWYKIFTGRLNGTLVLQLLKQFSRIGAGQYFWCLIVTRPIGQS